MFAGTIAGDEKKRLMEYVARANNVAARMNRTIFYARWGQWDKAAEEIDIAQEELLCLEEEADRIWGVLQRQHAVEAKAKEMSSHGG